MQAQALPKSVLTCTCPLGPSTFVFGQFDKKSVLTRTLVGRRLFIEQSCLFDLTEQLWWNKVVKVIQICFSCSMLCMECLLLHLVGKR